jgi:pimeloyl-ACP methyl ester carboxylesterase
MTATVAGIALKPRTIDAGGIQTSYLETGAGDPVVMLHGSGPGISAMANWQHNIGARSQRFRVLAPDIVGFGATKRPDDIVYSLRTCTPDPSSVSPRKRCVPSPHRRCSCTAGRTRWFPCRFR